jgi:uncharacterized protein involved in outer membrane biogenesis
VLLLIVAVAAAFVIGDPERVRQGIEQSVSSLSGKPFSIDGPFDLELGRVVSVSAERVRWQDPDKGQAPLLVIQDVAASIDLLSLLRRTVRITDLQVRDAALNFDWSGDRFNWRMGSGDAGPSGRAVPVLIDRASLQDVALTFRHPQLADEVRLQVVSAQHQADEADRLVVTSDLRLDDRDLQLHGHIGPLPQLVAAGAVDLDATLTGPLAEMTVTASTAALAELLDLVLDAKLRAPDAAALAQRVRLPLETAGDVDLSLAIDTSGAQARLRGKGHFGDYRLDSTFDTDDLTSLKGLAMRGSGSGPSARDLATLLGREALPDRPFEIALLAKRTDKGLELQHLQFDSEGFKVAASGVARSVEVIRDIDLDLHVEGDDFTDLAALLDLKVSDPVPYRLSTVIAGKGPNQHDDLDAQLQIGDTTGRLHGTLSETHDLVGSKLQFSLKSPDASQLPLLGDLMPAQQPFQLVGRMAFDADAMQIDDLEANLGAATLTGKVQLGIGHGRPTIAFDGNAKGPDLAGIINPLLPAALRDRLPRTEFTAATRLSFADSTLTIDEVHLTSAGSRAEFNGKLHSGGPGPSLAGQLSVSGERLANWLQDVDIAALGAPFEVKGALDVSAQSLRLDGVTASLGGTQLAGNLALSGEGLKDGRFDLRGQTDDLSGLIPRNTDYRPAARSLDFQIKGRHRPGTLDIEQFQASIGELKASIAGRLQHEGVWSAHQLRLDASGPRLSDLGTFGDYTPPDRPFTLKAAIDGDAKTQHIGDLQFRSGDNDLSGKLKVVPAERPRLELDLESDRFRLDDFFQPRPSGAATADAAQPNDQPPEDPIFGNEPLPFDLLDRFDAALRVRLDNLLSHQRHWRNVILDADVDNGAVQLKQASLDAAAGKLRLSGTLTPHEAGRALALTIEASDAMIASEAMTPEEIERLPRHAVDAQLSAVGNTPHELVSSLDGFVWIVGGKGYGPRTKLAPLYGDFLTQVLTSINPAHTEQTEVRIDCDGAYLEVEQGKVRTAPAIVMKTKNIIVVASGTVDLSSEALDVTIETTPMRGIGISLGDVINPLTKVSGTLQSPAIVLDPKGALIEGGAAVATYGLSIVAKSLAKRLAGSHKICQRIGEQAVEIRRKKDPDNLPELAAQFIKDDAKTDGRPAPAGPTDSDTGSPYDFLD